MTTIPRELREELRAGRAFSPAPLTPRWVDDERSGSPERLLLPALSVGRSFCGGVVRGPRHPIQQGIAIATTTDITSARIDPSLEPLSEWCEFSGNYHHESEDDGYDFGPVREHVLEFDHVVASTDQASPGKSQPYALVCVTVQEKSYYDHCGADDPTVALAAASYPHFTSTEARELAKTLMVAADRADEIADWRARESAA